MSREKRPTLSHVPPYQADSFSKLSLWRAKKSQHLSCPPPHTIRGSSCADSKDPRVTALLERAFQVCEMGSCFKLETWDTEQERQVLWAWRVTLQVC